MTGAGNNTYLLTDDGHALLVDAGVAHPEHLAALARALVDRDSALKTVVITHGHADHAAGAPAIARAYTTAVFARFASDGGTDEAAVRWNALHDGDRVVFGSDHLVVLHTPGHSPDHIALWHEPSRAIFAGDLVIPGRSVAIDITRGGRLSDYLSSLERLLELEPRQLFPAHGMVVDDPGRVIAEHIAHRLEREQQVIDALRAGHRTVEAIADSIYHGLEGFDPRLMAAARANVHAHLDKLKADGIAADHDEGWTL